MIIEREPHLSFLSCCLPTPYSKSRLFAVIDALKHDYFSFCTMIGGGPTKYKKAQPTDGSFTTQRASKKTRKKDEVLGKSRFQTTFHSFIFKHSLFIRFALLCSSSPSPAPRSIFATTLGPFRRRLCPSCPPRANITRRMKRVSTPSVTTSPIRCDPRPRTPSVSSADPTATQMRTDPSSPTITLPMRTDSGHL